MDSLAAFVILCLTLGFGVPILLIIIGLSRYHTDGDSAKKFLIVGVVWLLVGAGICATLIMA